MQSSGIFHENSSMLAIFFMVFIMTFAKNPGGSFQWRILIGLIQIIMPSKKLSR